MPRILIVDDQPDVRAMISMLLRVNHFEVAEANDAAGALRAFETAHFDAVIVDNENAWHRALQAIRMQSLQPRASKSSMDTGFFEGG